ncbi:MAG: PepSY domain-containing protein [Gammaproteobacteria bacterium]
MKLISNCGQRIPTCALPFLTLLITVAWLGLSGCTPTTQPEKASAAIPPLAKVKTDGEAPKRVWENFDAKNFTRPTIIDNEWLPLKPGSQWVYEGTTTEDGETFSHRIEFTVTDLTKEIAGVQSVVAFVVDYAKDDVVEKEIAFYAQDDDGTVWYLGEYPEEYEDGQFIKAPTWLAGLANAQAGIQMMKNPLVGMPRYFQGWGPEVDWTDSGKVYMMGLKTRVPIGVYEDVMAIDETSLSEPNAHQLKFYARGAGNVRVGWRGDDETKEDLELVKFTQLNPEALAKIRSEALELERNAYKTSPNVYALTTPIYGTAPQVLSQSPSLITQKPTTPDIQKISEEKAKEIALTAVPGDVTDVSIEKKLGANRYVVEVISKGDRSETDVIIDMQTGKVLATEK